MAMNLCCPGKTALSDRQFPLVSAKTCQEQRVLTSSHYNHCVAAKRVCAGVRPVYVSAVSSSSTSTSPYSATKETSYASKEFQALSSITIFSSDGSPVKFQNLWDLTNGKAVVAFLRHFGCPLCWEFAASLRDAKPKFDSAGVTLVVIGVGTPENARTMAERLPFPKEVLYADPGREAYKALDFYYGLGRTFFNPASAKVLGRFDTIRTALKDYTIDATPKDRSSVLQQGGLLVFKGTQLLFSRKDEGTGDHASLDDVLKIVS